MQTYMPHSTLRNDSRSLPEPDSAGSSVLNVSHGKLNPPSWTHCPVLIQCDETARLQKSTRVFGWRLSLPGNLAVSECNIIASDEQHLCVAMTQIYSCYSWQKFPVESFHLSTISCHRETGHISCTFCHCTEYQEALVTQTWKIAMIPWLLVMASCISHWQECLWSGEAIEAWERSRGSIATSAPESELTGARTASNIKKTPSVGSQWRNMALQIFDD